MNRRAFFGVLAAPLVAKAAPALRPGDVFTMASVNVVNSPLYEPQTWYARTYNGHVFYSWSGQSLNYYTNSATMYAWRTPALQTSRRARSFAASS